MSEQPKPATPPESAPVSPLGDLRARLDAIKSTSQQAQLAWENEKSELAREVIDMAEGNARLAKAAEKYKDFHDTAYDTEEKAIQGDITKFAQNKLEEERLRADIVRQQAETKDPGQQKALEELLETLFTQIQKTKADEGVATEKLQKTIVKNRGFKEERDAVARNPRKFALDQVVVAHTMATEGKEGTVDYAGKKQEIAHAADKEVNDRKTLEVVGTELPKLEEAIGRMEKTTASSIQNLSETLQKVQIDFATLLAEVESSGEEVERLKEVASVYNPPRFFGKLKYEEDRVNAKEKLRSMKKDFLDRNRAISDLWNNVMAGQKGVYYSQSTLVFYNYAKNIFGRPQPMSDLANERKILDGWAEQISANPKTLGGFKDQVENLRGRATSLQANLSDLEKLFEVHAKTTQETYYKDVKIGRAVEALFKV